MLRFLLIFSGLWLGPVSAALAATDTHGDGGSAGLPQFNADTYPSQLFWLFVAFIVLYVLMSRVALPPISSVLEARFEQRTGDLERAEKLQTETQEVKDTYEQALAKAHEDARQVTLAAETALKEEAAKRYAALAEDGRNRMTEAEAKITAAKADALKSVVDIAAEVAAAAAQKICNTTINSADAKQAVETALKEAA